VFVTLIGPYVAPTGDVTLNDVPAADDTLPRVAPNITTFLVPSVEKPVPDIVIVSPDLEVVGV
jgi:hypothetical protein